MSGGLLQRLTGANTDDSNEQKDDLTNREIAELVLHNTLGDDFDVEDATSDWIVEYEGLKEVQKLALYKEDQNDSRMLGLMGRNPESFNAHIRVSDHEDEGLQVQLQSVFYTEDKPKNDAVGDFIRTFSHRGPDVRFDIEGDEPDMRIYSY